MEQEQIVPIIEESLEVGKRQVVNGKVILQKDVREREETAVADLVTAGYDVFRVPVNQVVEMVPAVRQEGDTTVYPVVEEVLIVQKQLVLREEIHVTRKVSESHYEQTVTLRTEDVTVQREDAAKALPEQSSLA